MPYFITDNRKLLGFLKTSKTDVQLQRQLGIVRGSEMSFADANKLRGNPHYGESVEYNVNCQSAVVANELRRRGWDVEATGNSQQRNDVSYALSLNPFAAWIDSTGNIPIPEKCRFNTMPDIMSAIGRYQLLWQWKDKKYGHSILAERLPSGNIRFYDPQSGKVGFDFPLKAIDSKKGFDLLRIDNLEPNLDAIRGVVKPAGSKAQTPLMDDAQKAFWRKFDNAKSYVDGDNDSSNATKSLIWNRLKNSIVKDKERFVKYEDMRFENIKTKTLKRKTNSRKSLIQHCHNEQEINAAEFIWDNPHHLRFKRVSKLGEGKDMTNPKEKNNIDRKKEQGVTCYNVYEFTYKDAVYLIKTEVIKNRNEHLYSFTKK